MPPTPHGASPEGLFFVHKDLPQVTLLFNTIVTTVCIVVKFVILLNTQDAIVQTDQRLVFLLRRESAQAKEAARRLSSAIRHKQIAPSANASRYVCLLSS